MQFPNTTLPVSEYNRFSFRIPVSEYNRAVSESQFPNTTVPVSEYNRRVSEYNRPVSEYNRDPPSIPDTFYILFTSNYPALRTP